MCSHFRYTVELLTVDAVHLKELSVKVLVAMKSVNNQSENIRHAGARSACYYLLRRSVHKTDLAFTALQEVASAWHRPFLAGSHLTCVGLARGCGCTCRTDPVVWYLAERMSRAPG